MENVDEDGRAVPDGTPGARLLVTNLVNRVQPLIRLEVSDAMTLERDDVRLRPHAAAPRRVEGRAEDVIWLPGADGRPVAVVPMQFSVVARDRDVVEFQVAQEGARLVILVVGRGAAPGLEERVRAGVAERLHALGVAKRRDRRAPPRCPRALGRWQAGAGRRRSSGADNRLARRLPNIVKARPVPV